MKKTWKKILCSLMLAPCMFWAAACGDDPEDQSNLTVNLTAEQQQEAYTTLRTLASATLNNDGTKDQAYTLQYVLDRGVEKNIDNAGLTESNRAIVESARILDLTDKTTQVVYGGYKTNNEGYYVNKFVYDGKDYAESSSAFYSEIVKYQSSQYNNYSNDNGEKVVSKVTNDYSKNKVLFDKNVIEDTEAYAMVEFFNLIGTTDLYGDFKNALSTWISRTITDNRVVDNYTIDFSEYITSNYAFSLTGDVYTLTVNINLDATNSALMFLGDGNLVGAGNIVVSYKSGAIQKVSLDFDSMMVLEESPARIFRDIIEYQEFTANNKVISTDMRNTTVVLDFTTGFDSDFFNQNLAGYNGQGEAGAIVNRQPTITILSNLSNLEVKAVAGSNLMEVINNAMIPVLMNTDYIILSAYWNIETGSEVLTTDIVPTFDCDIHLVVIDREDQYIPTSIEVNYINHDDMSGEINLGLNRNLYDSIKAMWGLTDDQLLGIYSDEALENKLSTDTVVSEGMRVYVVIVDGWSHIPPEAL